MKSFPRSLVPSIFLSALLGAASPLRAGSIERAPATADDLAQALGLDLKKFTAKFAEPVYATLTLSWRQPGEELINQLKHSSSEPGLEHSILFTRKDYGKMQLLSGGANARQVKDLVEMDVKFSGTGFFYRDYNPFAKLPAGHPVQNFVKKQSFEDLPLDEPIPLIIEAAAKSPEKLMTSIQTEYAGSVAFIHLSVTFSKQKPAAASDDAAPAKTAVAEPAAPKPEAKSAAPKQ